MRPTYRSKSVFRRSVTSSALCAFDVSVKMNKKGKNKKGKIPSIPLSEKPDVIEKSEDKIVDLPISHPIVKDVGRRDEKDKIEKQIESAVDILGSAENTGVILSPAIELKDEETPKKPKRNRGKKKNDKGDIHDDSEDKPTETEVHNIEENIQDLQGTEVKQEDMPVLIPAARKKKNKKSTVKDKVEEQIAVIREVITMPEEKLTVTQESEETAEVSKNDQTEEIKAKKKNKKKKKSDKEDVSCITAFETILQQALSEETSQNIDKPVENIPEDSHIVQESEKDIFKENITVPPSSKKSKKLNKNKPTEEKSKDIDIPAENVIEISHISDVSDDNKAHENIIVAATHKKNKKSDKIKTLGEKTKEIEILGENVKDTSNISQISDKNVLEHIIDAAAAPLPSWDSNEFEDIPELSKHQKKNKKGKKHPIEFVEKSETITLDLAKAQEVELSENTDLKDVVITENIETDIKPKAKIAKPVEKKQKDKHTDQRNIKGNTQATDITLLDAATPVDLHVDAPKQSENIEPKAVETEQILNESSEITNAPSQVSSFAENKEEADDVKNIGKKKKKGSKSITDKTIDETQVQPKSIIETEIENTLSISDPSTSLNKFKQLTETSADAISDTVETSKVDILIEHSNLRKILLTPETTDSEKQFPKTDETIHKSEEYLKADTKSSKKRKKSPKPHRTTEKESTNKEEKFEETTKINVTENKEEPTILYELEISSVKADESEGSACDVIPDIVHPRASSQQLSDSNNNTFIREIFPVEETIVSPLITEQKIDQTSEKASEMKGKEEKTDIRSKMMEVNKDMEGLRLSIERSLAELTAMETKEKETEIKYEQQQSTKVDEIKKGDENKPATDFPVEKEENLVKKPLDEVIMETAIGDFDKKVDKIDIFSTTQPTETKENTEKDIASVATTIFVPESVSTEVIPDTPIIDKEIAETSLLSKKETELKKDKSPKTDTAKDLKVEETLETETPPTCPSRKDPKTKHKKRKGKQETQTLTPQSTTTATASQPQSTETQTKTDNKSENKTESNNKKDDQQKGKQQTNTQDNVLSDIDFEPIENFEDALTSSVDDVNKTFEIIAEESQEESKPKINVIPPNEEKTTVSPPKNLLGHPDFPVPSNRRDYKKEKDKIPNEITAKVEIKDSVDIERKQSKNTQTVIKVKDLNKINNEEFVYKYSFRKVFLQSSCHVCKKDLAGNRMACSYCNLVFYCSNKHKDEDWPQHQALCFAVSTIVHLKDQKHIYGDAKNITGHDYRLIRMQMIVSCEKVLKRRLVPWEQEALLYPRICAHVPCREWRQGKLSDCEGCGQISFCKDNLEHLPKSHSRWCKSYCLYQKLVCYQQTVGRLEPKLPTKVMDQYVLPEKINEVLAAMYEEKIDMTDIQYAALTQLATAPLTAAYCYQLYRNKIGSANGVNKKSTFTIHVVGAELQFEADALNKWEVFFLHLRPEVQELRVVLINSDLNPSKLPLELLGKIKFCANCRQKRRRVVFSFQDKSYTEYKTSEDFLPPDLVCAFNPSIQRASIYNGKDHWPTTANTILKLKIPFIITAYTLTELHKDCIRIKECAEISYSFVTEPKYNNFASVRPDRNFISDDEMPLLFKNYCYAVIYG